MNFRKFRFLGVVLQSLNPINCSFNGKGTTGILLHKYISFSSFASGTNSD
jgi:hypothetical protein